MLDGCGWRSGESRRVRLAARWRRESNGGLRRGLPSHTVGDGRWPLRFGYSRSHEHGDGRKEKREDQSLSHSVSQSVAQCLHPPSTAAPAYAARALQLYTFNALLPPQWRSRREGEERNAASSTQEGRPASASGPSGRFVRVGFGVDARGAFFTADINKHFLRSNRDERSGLPVAGSVVRTGFKLTIEELIARKNSIGRRS